MWESRLSGSERALGGGEMSRTSKPTPRATRPRFFFSAGSQGCHPGLRPVALSARGGDTPGAASFSGGLHRCRKPTQTPQSAAKSTPLPAGSRGCHPGLRPVALSARGGDTPGAASFSGGPHRCRKPTQTPQSAAKSTPLPAGSRGCHPGLRPVALSARGGDTPGAASFSGGLHRCRKPTQTPQSAAKSTPLPAGSRGCHPGLRPVALSARGGDTPGAASFSGGLHRCRKPTQTPQSAAKSTPLPAGSRGCHPGLRPVALSARGG
jgi:hypothetical protein